VGRMAPALWFIAELYQVEGRAAVMTAAERLCLRQTESKPILQKLHSYLETIQEEVLPKSPAGRAVRYALKNWTALNRYCEDEDLSIDNNATERDIRGVAIVATTGSSSAVTGVARLQPSCQASRHPVGGWAWSPSPGSKTCFLELPPIRLTALLSFCHTTGNQFLPDNRPRSCKTLNSPGVAAPWGTRIS
jgi:hypothetical protein